MAISVLQAYRMRSEAPAHRRAPPPHPHTHAPRYLMSISWFMLVCHIFSIFNILCRFNISSLLSISCLLDIYI